MTGHQDPSGGHCPASPPAWPSVQTPPGGRGPQQLPELRCFALLEEEAVLKALSTAKAEAASGPGETLPGGCAGHVTTHGRPTRPGGTPVPRDSRGSERPPAHTSCPWCLRRSPQAAGEVADPSWTESQAAATLGLAGTPLRSPEMAASHITPSVQETSAGHHTSSGQRQTLPRQQAGRWLCTLSPRATAGRGPREPLNRQQQSLGNTR